MGSVHPKGDKTWWEYECHKNSVLSSSSPQVFSTHLLVTRHDRSYCVLQQDSIVSAATRSWKYSSSKKPHEKKAVFRQACSMNGSSDCSGPSVSQASSAPSFCKPFAVNLPEKLGFWMPNDCKRWTTQWEDYLITSKHKLQNVLTQVKIFLYAVGKEAEDALTSLNLSEAELNDYC